MSKRFVLAACAGLIAAVFVAAVFLVQNFGEHDPGTQNTPEATASIKARVAEAYGKIPIHFEKNLGQTDKSVDFVSRGNGYSLFLKREEALLSLSNSDRENPLSTVVRLRIDGMEGSNAPVAIDETEGKSNYFIGNEPDKWQSDIPNYKKVKYESVYDGIDVVYYGNQRELEYDFVVAPNADPGNIRLKIDGVKGANVDRKTGDLLLETELGEIRQHKPYSYQIVDGKQIEVPSKYLVSKSNGREFDVSFELAAYDKLKELVIDPILVYGSYLGGSEFDSGSGVAVDAAGNAYIVGTAKSVDFPTTAGTVKPEMLPRSGTTNSFWYDAFVTKINPEGTAIVFSTYFGGRASHEGGKDVKLDTAGNVYVFGSTNSTDFPIVNAYQTTFGGTDDAFAAKLNPTGSAIIYSTFLGGRNTDTAARMAINPETGEATFSGRASPDFPTTPGVLKEKLCDSPTTCSGVFYSGSYVARLASNGDIRFATLFDGGVRAVSLDANENAVVAGTGSAALTTPGAYQTTTTGGVEGYVGKLNPTGTQIVFGTLLGGGLESDVITGVVLDSSQNIYVTGQTENPGFPTTSGAFDTTFNGVSGTEDGFLTKFNAAGDALIYSTFLGGIGRDEPKGIALGSDNSAFVVGETTMVSSFPLRNSLLNSGRIFLTHFNPDASGLEYSTILGLGSSSAVAVDAADNAYITGQTSNVLVTAGSFQPGRGGGSITSPDDAYILKIGPADENQTFYSISGSVSGGNTGTNYSSVVATISGTVNRSIIVGYSGGTYSFGSLPAGGNYTVTVTKPGFEVSPESAVFNNLGANQTADFTILNNTQPEGVITSPAHGTNFDAPATITIQATASDADAGDTIQKVDFVAYNSTVGSVEIGTDTTAPYEITWSDVPVGTWALYAIPTDNHGLRGYSIPTVHVFVNDPAPASVAFTSPAEGSQFEQNTNVSLSVDVSSSVTYVEVHDETGELVAIRNRSPWTMLWWANEIAEKTLIATAYNAEGESATSVPLNISIVPINHTISGTIYDSITLARVPNATVNLTGTNSISATTTTDENGDYSFTDLGGSTSDIVTITPSLSGYTFEPESRSFTLNFIDHTNQNFEAVAVTGINVGLTSPSANQQFPPAPTISLAANATSDSNSITRVEFYARKQGILVLQAEDTTAPYSYEWENAPSGTSIYLYARAYDDVGGIAESAEVRISVAAAPSVVRLQGDVTDANGGRLQGITLRLTGNQNGQPVNQTAVSNSFGAYGFFNLPVGGDYTITPEATGGTTYTPESFSVTNATVDNYDIDFQASTVNQAPVVQISSPSEGAEFTMPVTIPMTATATDPGGQVVHFTMSAVSSTRSYSVGEVNNGNFDIQWQAPEPGTYTVYATARDNSGSRTTEQVTITINPPAPVSVSGRVVDRDSNGIGGVTLMLDNLTDNTVPDLTIETDPAGNYTIPNVPTFNSYRLKAAKLNYTFAPQYRNYFDIATDQTTGDFTGTLQVQPSDFDGDGGTDMAVWRPSDGVWHLNRSNSGYSAYRFGGAEFGDVPAPADYDGDGKIDSAVYRNGFWFILRSGNSEVDVYYFGLATDKPVPGDYDGDGKSDIAVWRPESGVWYIIRSSDGAYDFRQFGTDGDVPLVGDYDGDGKTDLTVWRPSTGYWYVLQSSDSNFTGRKFGTDGDIPLVGDFDGDKIVDYTVFRPSTGSWYVLRSTDSGLTALQWGIATDIPVPGDFDRDGRTDFGVFRPSEGNWYIYGSVTGAITIEHFGTDGDIPIPAAFSP